MNTSNLSLLLRHIEPSATKFAKVPNYPKDSQSSLLRSTPPDIISPSSHSWRPYQCQWAKDRKMATAYWAMGSFHLETQMPDNVCCDSEETCSSTRTTTTYTYAPQTLHLYPLPSKTSVTTQVSWSTIAMSSVIPWEARDTRSLRMDVGPYATSPSIIEWKQVLHHSICSFDTEKTVLGDFRARDGTCDCSARG